MTCLIVALYAEARPLIDRLQLKPSSGHKFPVYENQEIILIVSGIGKIRAAMAATYLYNQLPAYEIEKALSVNIGLCGSKDSNAFQLGDMVIINQVVDHGSQRRYFPDMLLRHDLKEGGLATFDQPVTNKNMSSMPLVDMEASGFFEAATPYVSPDRILCIKIVSDYLDGQAMSKIKIGKLFSPVLREIPRLLSNFNRIHRPQEPVLSEAEEYLLAELGRHLKLTVTQRYQLRKLAEGYRIRHRQDLKFLKTYLTKDVSSKYEAKQDFHAIKSSLSQP